MTNAKQILAHFDGNISKAARETKISRTTWHKWKNIGFPKELPPELELWALKQSLEATAAHSFRG